MKKTTFILSILIIGFFLLSSSLLTAQVVDLEWNTFLGTSSTDRGYAVTLDSSDNIYMIGVSNASWGTPVNAYSGGQDVVIVCLDNSGSLLWNTFLGSSNWDEGLDIALDSAGNIYVIGFSIFTWGTPINAHSGSGGSNDTFIARLDSSGNLVWNTFLGGSGEDLGVDIALDSSGNIFVTGFSDATWGSPVYNYSGGEDIFVARLDSSGNLLWNTFLGSVNNDEAWDITLDNSGHIYVTGDSYATWGFPINAHNGNQDAFVVCLDNTGHAQWNTFLGSASGDSGWGIALNSSGNVYVTGFSNAAWGSPINAHSGSSDAFIAALDSSGGILWNTFLGSGSGDQGGAVSLDSSGNVYVAGSSDATWGSPLNAHSGNKDALVVCLASTGSLLWHTFLGHSNYDACSGIALNSTGNIYISGSSDGSWGSPISAHNGGFDAFVALLNSDPLPDIKANDSDGPISITQSDTLQIRVSLQRWGSSENVDYWLAYKGPSGWVHYNNTTKKWETGLGVTHQGPLMDLNNKKVFQSAGLAPGVYTFYFGVDMVMDGKVTKSSLYKDEVKVTVTQ